MSIAQDILRKSTDVLRRIIAPVDGMGGVTLSYVCPQCSCFPLEDYIWWVSTGHGDGNNRKKTNCNWWCAACGGQYEWRAPNMILVVQIGANTDRAKVFKARAGRLGLCAWRTSSKMVISRFKAQTTGLHETSRRGIMDGLRRFIEADNHSAVDAGDLRRGTISVRVKKPLFSETFPEAAITEGADELTLRAYDVGTQRAFIDTEHIEFERWGPPLVDADWHAFCQAIYKGIEVKEWEELCYHNRIEPGCRSYKAK